MQAWLPYMPPAMVVFGAAILATGERRVHRYNYEFLKALGGEELAPREMRRYFDLVDILPLVASLSSFVLSSRLSLPKTPILGVAFIVVGLFLRLWSIRSLGRFWTRRCIYIPGISSVGGGPYKYLKHPEYLGRTLESLGFLLFFGINPISLMVWVRTLWLLHLIRTTESRQIAELTGRTLHLGDASSTVFSS